MSDKRKNVAQRTIEALRRFAGCNHEWVAIADSDPKFGGLEDRPMLVGTYYRCLKCGARTRTVSTP